MSLWQRVSQAVQAFALTQKRVPTAFASTLTLTGREPVLKLTVPELVGDAGYAQEPCSVCPVQKGTESQRPLLPDSHNYHEIRLDAGLTARALSAAAGWHEAKTSRIESAQQAVSDADIQPWCQVCGAGRQAPDLIAASRAADSHSPGRRFAVVVEESVLRYQLGSSEIMAAQLGHLLSILAAPSVSLGAIPFPAAGRPLWTLEAFTVFDDSRVHVELLSAQVTVTAPGGITLYVRAFEKLAELAVHGLQARALIIRA